MDMGYSIICSHYGAMEEIREKYKYSGTQQQAIGSHLPQLAAFTASVPGKGPTPSAVLVMQISENQAGALSQAPPLWPRACALTSRQTHPLASPARVVVATAAAREELGEDGGPRGSSQTTRRRCPRARRVPRRQRRGLARGRAAWAAASLRFPGSGPATSAGAAAEAEAPTRLSPPLQLEPGEARRPGCLEGGSAVREWEFSSPEYGDCSITRGTFLISLFRNTPIAPISIESGKCFLPYVQRP
ncbi:ADP-ribosylation factor-like protein 5A isoform X2 [Macaca mulatta]